MSRRELWRWLGWFIAANAGLCFLIGIRYLASYHWPESLTGIVYAPVAMLGNFAFLITFVLTLAVGPLIAIKPLHRMVMPLAVLITALVLALLVLDTNVYAERRIHLGLLVAALFEPVTWIAAGFVFAVALLFEAMLARRLSGWLGTKRAAGGRFLALALGLCWLVSQGLHIWADAVGYSPVTRFTGTIPLYYPQTAKRQLARLGLVDPERVRQASLLRRGAQEEEGELRYPLAPLACARPVDSPSNLLWVVIDALRPDALDAALTPAIAAFRAESQAFDDHWSAGNSSRMGAFGMFYGLPSTYFHSFYVAERAPLLLDHLRSQGFEIMSASAPGFGSPMQLDRTVFAGETALHSAEGLGRVEGNDRITEVFEQWIAKRRDTRPYFGLLWFNHSDADIGAVGGELPSDGRYAGNEEARTRWNRYRRGLRAIDADIGRVLAALEQAGHTHDTLVLVMGDHGFEFDDLGLGYYGHASNYARYQLQTPLLMRWPGRAPRVYTHRSSHLDLPATLFQEWFGCSNTPSDYGMGRNLFEGRSWDWIIAGSYHSYAIVEPDRILLTTPVGFAEVLGPDYRPAENDRLDAALIEEAIAEMRRFYR